MKPIVSVCCITFNQENFIEETLKGFLLQRTQFPIEILIHDDASSDKTSEVLRHYQQLDSRISVIYQKENQYSQGKKPYLNFLFPKAQGKYIAMCEGDDIWVDPLKLQKQVEFLEKNSEFVMTYHDAHNIDVNGVIFKKNIIPLDRKRDFSSIELQQGILVLPLTMCFRNVFKDKTDYPPEIFEVKNGDTFLISLLGHHGKGKFMDNIEASLYREHNGGVWSNQGEENKSRQQIITYNKLLQYYTRMGNIELSGFFRYKMVNSHLSLIRHTVSHKNFREAYKHSKYVLNYSSTNIFRNLFFISKSILQGIIYEKN